MKSEDLSFNISELVKENAQREDRKRDICYLVCQILQNVNERYICRVGLLVIFFFLIISFFFIFSNEHIKSEY